MNFNKKITPMKKELIFPSGNFSIIFLPAGQSTGATDVPACLFPMSQTVAGGGRVVVVVF